ncbi:3-hydroxyacyl-CoA dehydrogenase family protein [Specibacter sp. NPDC078709]|uniref:3-hydroxyacyl-CoA dehydrogenase family protein n=1 Tax=Specibacter sp. NPDC078709 TaxID=3154364 RepID=UPI003434A000
MRNPAAPTSALPQYVGVLGGGRMGSGIAHAFLMAGCNVRVVESDAGAAAAARSRVERAVEKSLARSGARMLAADGEQAAALNPTARNPATLNPATLNPSTLNPAALDKTPPDVGALAGPGIMERFAVFTDVANFANCALVVEAVPEDRDLKVAALRRTEPYLAPTAVLASNSSALSLTDLAAQLVRPAQFLGLHFFNPVPSSALVEIVRGQLTPDALVTTAQGWVAALGKTAVVVADSPGFASSRLGVALALEAMRMLQDEVASAEDIDAAMVLGYRHQTGPLRTTDLVGLDVRLDIAEHLAATLGPRFAAPDILREKVARGELGRKTGRGFFDWDADSPA